MSNATDEFIAEWRDAAATGLAPYSGRIAVAERTDDEWTLFSYSTQLARIDWPRRTLVIDTSVAHCSYTTWQRHTQSLLRVARDRGLAVRWLVANWRLVQQEAADAVHTKSYGKRAQHWLDTHPTQTPNSGSTECEAEPPASPLSYR